MLPAAAAPGTYVVRLAPDGWKEKLTYISEAENIQAEHEADRLSFFRRKLKPLAEGARQGRQGDLQRSMNLIRWYA